MLYWVCGFNIYLGAQNNRLIDTVLLSTHNICFGLELRKIIFCTVLTDHYILPFQDLTALSAHVYTIYP